ncbi:MAG TPA: substrate-binding domain-containing protein [Blastocatellia bacterium]|jgi:rhamnose transport system permease protein|nr:substrate-binding domain-containing protein [Blastocatellia bacterium]
MTPSFAFATEEPLWRRLFPNHEWALVAMLFVETAIFAFIGDNFFTGANGFEIIRLSVEVGLLAMALTPVIITGGIDLSVGSMMGLSAVVCGWLWRDAGLPIWASAALTLTLGLFGGGLNALLIARFNLPPLIVTLGTFSLFRGLAEGITGGVDNYTGFPQQFLFLGQGYLFGILPPQALALIAVAVFYYLLLHRAIIGRSLYAIGFSAEGARYAGIPAARRVGLVYLLSGLAASLAAVIYIAHLGQAKSDAGTGYELFAITAVVLGGTSIFGGRGTLWGTALGLFAIVILQNGLRLADLPAELSGILTGFLLVITICIDRFLGAHASQVAGAGGTTIFGSKPTGTPALPGEEIKVKNSQVAILSAVILAAALIVAGSNWLLVRSLRERSNNSAAAAPTSAPAKRLTVAMMPKAKGDPYFVSCRKGAEEAARELGVDLIWDGPTDLDPAKQNEVVEGWITRGVDVIAVSVENKVGISTVLKRARERGIRVLTWDADAQEDARDFFINQATPQGIGQTLTDEAARILGGKGEFAIITASMSAANQNEWIKRIKARLAEKYPDLKLVATQPSDGDRDRAFAETQTVLKVHPNVKLIMGIAAPAVPGAAEAVKQSGRKDVKVIGLSLPNLCKSYVHDGVIESVVLWNTLDLGYLTVYAANELGAGKLKRGAVDLKAGKLGAIQVREADVLLGAPFIFNKSNIDRFDF